MNQAQQELSLDQSVASEIATMVRKDSGMPLVDKAAEGNHSSSVLPEVKVVESDAIRELPDSPIGSEIVAESKLNMENQSDGSTPEASDKEVSAENISQQKLADSSRSVGETATIPMEIDQLLRNGAEAMLAKYTTETGTPEMAKQVEIVRLAVGARGKYADILKKDALKILEQHSLVDANKVTIDLQKALTSLELELISRSISSEEISMIKAHVGERGMQAIIHLASQGKLADLGKSVFGSDVAITPDQMRMIAGRIGYKEQIDWKKRGKQGALYLLILLFGVGQEGTRTSLAGIEK